MTSGEQAAAIALGTIFLLLGIPSCVLALFRSREHCRILGWFGLFSTMYGVRIFAEVPVALGLREPFVSIASRLVWLTTYLILIPAVLFLAELSRGALRRWAQVMAIVAGIIAVGVLASVIATRRAAAQPK